jgi:carbon starvation protein CstA
MISFFIGVGVLLIGFFFYSRLVERVFGIQTQQATPAYALQDNVDYVPMGWGKIFLIQFLNIAGLGPIFGAILGAAYGPVVFFWIALGCVLGGAVHDYLSGMLSLRLNGLSIAEIVGRYLGLPIKQFMRVFTVILMIMVGAVFITGPAEILATLTKSISPVFTVTFWVVVIIVYYVMATLLPIDKLIGRVYPFFGFALLFMAAGILGGIFYAGYAPYIPEAVPANLFNMKSNASASPIFPMIFITVACGAVSGFHATQSPLMARCLKSEKKGRNVFYGAMIAEGLVAMIWAAAAMAFFRGVPSLNEAISLKTPASLVNEVSVSLLGTFGGFLAVLGVVAAPISTGDTAFRSARLIIADFLKFDQKPLLNRIIISLPLFVVGVGLSFVKFEIIWKYMTWANQSLAVIVLWAVTVYLRTAKKWYFISLAPALFMTMVVTTYILMAPIGFRLSYSLALLGSTIITAFLLFAFYRYSNPAKVVD